MNNLVFIDIETTGLNPAYHEIIEIALIGHDFKYHKKVRPEMIEHADSFALQLNGYDPQLWQDAVSHKQLIFEIAPLLKDCTLAGHNVSFDIEFLEEAYVREGRYFGLKRRRIDTVTLAYEHLYPLGLNSLSLDAIRDFLEWDKKGSHSALKDCKDAKRLFNYLRGFSAFKGASLKAKRAIKTRFI